MILTGETKVLRENLSNGELVHPSHGLREIEQRLCK